MNFEAKVSNNGDIYGVSTECKNIKPLEFTQLDLTECVNGETRQKV